MTFYGKSIESMIVDDLAEDVRTYERPDGTRVEIGQIDEFRFVVEPEMKMLVSPQALRQIRQVQRTGPPTLTDLFPGLKKPRR